MNDVARLLVGGGALLMALAVILGAFSAHAAKAAVHAEAARLMHTAVLYHLVHGLGILACGILARPAGSMWLLAAGGLMFLGIVMFCGSLWWLAYQGRSLGPVAPIGGTAFIAGWIALAIYAFTRP